MKIIREGSIDFLYRPIRFECHQCGCIFEAAKGEYEYCGNQREGDDYKISCPFCCKICYSIKKVGW